MERERRKGRGVGKKEGEWKREKSEVEKEWKARKVRGLKCVLAKERKNNANGK